MISPHPRNKRAKHPTKNDQGEIAGAEHHEPIAKPIIHAATPPPAAQAAPSDQRPAPVKSGNPPTDGFANTPFVALDINGQQPT